MHFLTVADARSWCEGRVQTDDAGWPVRPSRRARHARVPVSSAIAFCRALENALQPRYECLLWVSETDVWRSSENLHLYYRLRQSYGDFRRLHEAPAHLFHPFEAADLISFLQVGIQNGWDMHVLPSEGYLWAFVSHDEVVEIASDDGENFGLVESFANAQGGSRIVSSAPAT